MTKWAWTSKDTFKWGDASLDEMTNVLIAAGVYVSGPALNTAGNAVYFVNTTPDDVTIINMLLNKSDDSLPNL